MPIPEIVSGAVEIIPEVPYPTYRLIIIGVGLLVALFLFFFISRTRTGMLIRAGASNGPMIRALGVNIRLLYSVVFAIGVSLAGVAGMLAAPVETVYPGMGEQILIVSFVVVVIGGIGSIRGAFIGALAIGLADVYGQVFLPDLASVAIYGVMAGVLLWRPSGLFGRGT